MASGHDSKRRGGTLLAVHLAGLVGVQDLERFLQARRVEQELEVIFAAVGEEVDNFLIRLHGRDDLIVAQGPAAVFVDELEAAPSGRFELSSEFFDFLLRGLGLQFAPRRALGQLVRQRRLDTIFPLDGVDVAVSIGIEHRERGLEARGHEQVLQVLVAAVG